MTHAVEIIKTDSTGCPRAFQNSAIGAHYSRIWTIGKLDILDKELLGFFCSVKCPGQLILDTYDLARALRDAEIPVISGFHAPIEKDCMDLLLRGKQPLVVCPARGIERMRIPAAWRKSLDQDRLLVISPFEPKHRRPTIELTEKRNRFVAAISNEIFISYATKGGKLEQFCREQIEKKKKVYTFNNHENNNLTQLGSIGISIDDLIDKVSQEK
ncbi:MAG: DNA-processing protein DprA [Deltaproteobacteria bacterium]|nr:DNA-processing protein DprA [Deltaproteobacteria bacterium]